MILSQLLDEIRYGKQVVEETSDKQKIVKCLHEDTQELVISQRLSDAVSLLREENEDTEVIKRFDKIKNKFTDFEERYFDGQDISKAYSKMKLNSIAEDFNVIVKQLDDRKTYKRFDNKNLSKALATVQYGLKFFGSDASVQQPQNALLNTYLKEDLEFIEEVMG